MNKNILAAAILGLVVLSVSFSGCINFGPTPPDVRLTSTIGGTWGANSLSTINSGLKVSGQLLGPNGDGIDGRTIVFSGSNDVTWNPDGPSVGSSVQLQTTTTVNGNFAFTLRSGDDKYQIYLVGFNGDPVNTAANYKGSGFGVAGYHGLLADANQLTKNLIALPNSAFTPGTKATLLATLNTFSLQVSHGQYKNAANTLNGVLQRTDGYATSGAPDNNDYVRTNLAQYQLDHLLYLGTKDCQWLSGAPWPGQLAGAPAAP